MKTGGFSAKAYETLKSSDGRYDKTLIVGLERGSILIYDVVKNFEMIQQVKFSEPPVFG